MRIAYLDCFSGISGDMFLGALVDAGVSPGVMEKTVESLHIGAELKISRVNRSGISATKVDVIVDGENDKPRPSPQGLHAGHPHPQHDHDHHNQHGRGLKEIREILSGAGISNSAKDTAAAVFEKLGQAESKIHNVSLEKVHFHEVGAVDALVDIVCAAAGSEALGVDEFVCSPLNVGSGMVECAHGTFPVPAPATVELLKGAPVYSSGVQAELVTPTGAAIAAVLAKRFSAFPQMRIEKSGYGAGSRDFTGRANVLRIIVGECLDDNAGEGALATSAQQDTISVLEANLDDLSPQVVGYAMDRLFQAGALDVFCVPVQMKKNRPGTLLTVLSKPGDADSLARIIFAETTTLGVRRREEQRQVLARNWETVDTRFGQVRMKIASMNGSINSYAPEYEDCRRIALERKIALKTVMNEAMAAFSKSQKG